MSLLTEADKQILPLALRQNKQFHIATKWYLGWEPLWYQYAFHHALQPNVLFLAGIAAGKTTNVAASYMMDCLTIPYFRALNTSVTAKQAELPFEMAMTWIEDNNRLEHLIENISLRPYPTIKFVNGSEWVFRTMGKDAKYLRGLEFDRINIDECGLDYSGESIKVLRGRLRGKRPDGTRRMARMDMITSPTDAPWLAERFSRGDKTNAQANLRAYLSMRITTYDNTHLTAEQIAMMEAEYTDEMIDVELKAMFPDYGMSMFPKGHVHACIDQSLNDAAYEALHPETGRPLTGYVVEEHPRHGITKFELPRIPGHIYIMGGDPGTDSPPKRNTACVMVADVTVNPHRIVYFDWVDGRGSYNPFLGSYKYAINKYKPSIRGMDTTGTQKAIDELAFENMGISIDGINFQKDKEAMLNSLSLAITNHELQIPVIKGLQRQLLSYTRENDKKPGFAQDIVMTLAQIAFLARYTSASENESSDPVGSRARPSRRIFRSRRRRL